MIDQMEESLKFGKKLIDSELNTGIFDFIVKPIVKSFYKYWSEKDAQVGILEQIRITLETAAELVKNGSTFNEENYGLIERNFPIYLKNDQTDKQCKKNHRNYSKLKEITKNCFISQVKEAMIFLSVKEQVTTYEELCRSAFDSKEKALAALKKQIDFNEQGISIVEGDDSILNVPAGKNIILKVLRKGFELTKTKLIEELDEIYN